MDPDLEGLPVLFVTPLAPRIYAARAMRAMRHWRRLSILRTTAADRLAATEAPVFTVELLRGSERRFESLRGAALDNPLAESVIELTPHSVLLGGPPLAELGCILVSRYASGAVAHEAARAGWLVGPVLNSSEGTAASLSLFATALPSFAGVPTLSLSRPPPPRSGVSDETEQRQPAEVPFRGEEGSHPARIWSKGSEIA